MISLTTFLISFALGAILLILFKNQTKEKGNLPPGPFAWPFVGNLFSLGNHPHKAFLKWSDKYGKMCTIAFGSNKMVVLSDPALIREAFNDPNITGRPDADGFTILSDGPHGVINSHGQEWVDQRRFTLRHLRDFGFGKNVMEEMIMEEVNELISFIKVTEGEPKSLGRRLNLIVFNSLWRIMSGQRHTHDDPVLQGLLDGFNKLRNENGRFFFISFFLPALSKMFPNATGWNKLLNTIQEQREFAKTSIKEHQNDKPEDGVPRDFIDAYLKEIEATQDKSSSFYKDAGIKSLLAVILDLFNAGSETTATTLNWTFLYLAKFSECQKKLQQELDTVVGKNRQVALEDRPNMPYTEATILEILRYSTIVPFGVMHTTTADIDFHGYHLPKGTWVTANQYHVHYNKDLWDSPETFNPERFLSQDRKKVQKSENFMAFSLGKRQCLGETLARDELFLFITNIFQRFTVKLAQDSLNVSVESKAGPAMEPQPYHVVFTDRL